MCLYIRILVNIFRSARASNTVHAALCPGFAKYVDFFTRYFGEFRVLRDFPVNRANFQTCPHKWRPQGKPITYSIRTENENGQTFYYICTQHAVLSGTDTGVCAKSCERPFFVRGSHKKRLRRFRTILTIFGHKIPRLRAFTKHTTTLINERTTMGILRNNNRIIKLDIITE